MPGTLVTHARRPPRRRARPARRRRCPPAALARVGARGFGVYVHVPFCASRCGYCDFNTYTADRAGRRRPAARRYADAVLAELALAAPGARRRRARGRHGLRRRRHADPAARRRPGPDPRRHRRAPGGWPPTPRSPPRPTPSRSTPASLQALRGGRLHPDLAGHAVGRAGRAGASWTAGTPPGRAAAAAAGGPRGRVRARQPGPDLRHAGGDAPRTSPPRWTRSSAPGSTTSARTR